MLLPPLLLQWKTAQDPPAPCGSTVHATVLEKQSFQKYCMQVLKLNLTWRKLTLTYSHPAIPTVRNQPGPILILFFLPFPKELNFNLACSFFFSMHASRRNSNFKEHHTHTSVATVAGHHTRWSLPLITKHLNVLEESSLRSEVEKKITTQPFLTGCGTYCM